MLLDKDKIREVMKKKGIKNQTQLAELLGISKNQLSVILSEKFSPLKSNVSKLCEIMGVSFLSIIKEKPLQLKLDFKGAKEKSKVLNISHSTNKNQKYRVLELFAGAGGLALGLEQAGLETVALIEFDKYCCETLKLNRPSWNVIHSDVKDVDFTIFNNIDIVTGGFPCQAFSYAGKKLGFEDTRGTLFYEFARCIRDTQPLLFMAENVRGLLSHQGGKTLDTILNVFREFGYDVQYKLLNAVNHGVPQKRERVIIIGTVPGINFDYPSEDDEIKVLRDALIDVPLSDGIQYSAKKKSVLERVPPGGCWRDLPLEIQKEYMGVSFYSSGGRTGMARRISWDEPSLTLTCSPSQKQTERCHPQETRPFTVREYSRIQTFPDNWEFTGGVGEKYKQIGNAVPVRLAYKLGKQIVNALNESLNRNSIITQPEIFKEFIS